MARSRPRVVFAVAAGARMGFGHLLRARALARALDVPFVVALRGTTAPVARRLGATVLPAGARAIAAHRPDLVVVDDPNRAAGRRWIAWARARGARVISIHDLGRGYLPADLTVDGTFLARGADLAGPSFALIDPAFARRRARGARRQRGFVLIALGGGGHVRRWGGAVAAAILRLRADARVVVAAGFAGSSRWPLPRGVVATAPERLPDLLARCAVAVLGGGVTLYEACALGTPIVALAMARGQRGTIRAAAARGAALDAGSAGTPAAIDRTARLVADVLAHDAIARRLGACGRTLVDADGAGRVAGHVRAWLSAREIRHAA